MWHCVGRASQKKVKHCRHSSPLSLLIHAKCKQLAARLSLERTGQGFEMSRKFSHTPEVEALWACLQRVLQLWPPAKSQGYMSLWDISRSAAANTLLNNHTYNPRDHTFECQKACKQQQLQNASAWVAHSRPTACTHVYYPGNFVFSEAEARCLSYPMSLKQTLSVTEIGERITQKMPLSCPGPRARA